MKNNFFDQYKDPRWQKRRLKILERDNFTCTSCNDSKSTLNVHHTVPYEKDKKIWEYEDCELTTFCETCHKEISEIIMVCRSLIMGRCFNVPTAEIMRSILESLDGLPTFKLLEIKQDMKKKIK